MERNELILALCREAGETEPDDMLMIVDWECNHANCCDGERIEQAARGEVSALIQVRRCAGLAIFS